MRWGRRLQLFYISPFKQFLDKYPINLIYCYFGGSELYTTNYFALDLSGGLAGLKFAQLVKFAQIFMLAKYDRY